MSETSENPDLVEARRLIRYAEQALNAGTLPLEIIHHHAEEAARLIKNHDISADNDLRRLLAAAHVLRGHAKRAMGTPVSREESVSAYDDALELLNVSNESQTPLERNEIANAWTNRGITLLNEPTKEALQKAVASFDQAIEVRQNLPLDENSAFRWGLSAAWMNRADALTRLGGEEELKDAVRSYDEALKQLLALPPESHSLFHNRLATAWMNRGMTAQAQNTEEGRAEAVRSFDEAITVLRSPALAEFPVHHRTLAAALMNKGMLLFTLEDARAEEVQKVTHEALSLVAAMEDKDPISADIALRARHLVCRSMATQLEGSTVEQLIAQDHVIDATDIVDDGMKLARLWDSRGLTHFRPLATELFQFGSRIYQVCQPHFLSEYLLEHLDPAHSPDAMVTSHEMHNIAGEALWNAALAMGELQRASASLNPEKFQRAVSTLEELHAADVRLAELRQQYLTGQH